MSEKFTLRNRLGYNIVGILSSPQKPIVGTAVLQHGYSGVKEQEHILVLQEVFLSHGFQVFNFDATNSFGESDGHIRDARLGLHAQDFEDVVEWVKSQDWYQGKLLVSGHSMGGFSSVMYAANHKVDILVPVSPTVAGYLTHEAHKKNKPNMYENWKKEGVLLRESKSIPGAMKESPWEMMEEILDHNALDSAADIDCPSLLITGENDDVSPPEDLQLLFDTLGSNEKVMKIMKIMEGAPHTFRIQKDLNNLRTIVDAWLSSLSL